MKKLTDICDIQYGYAFDSKCFTEDSSYPALVRIRDVKRGYSETYYAGEYPEEYVLSAGDLLVGMDGEFNIARWKCEGALLNQRVCKLSAKTGTNEEYLRFAMSKALKEIEQRTAFVTVKHLSAKELNKLELAVPEISEQDRIADMLTKLECIIEARQQELQKLDELIKARFVEMFGDVLKNPKGFEFCSFGDYVVQMNIGPFGSDLKNDCFVSKENGYCMVYEQKHAIDKDMTVEARFVTKEKYNQMKRFDIGPGDIIVSCRGTIGRCFMLPENAPHGIIHPSLMMIKPKDSVNHAFLVCLLENILKEQQENGSGVKMAIKATELSKIQCIKPSRQLQDEYIAFVAQADKSKFAAQKALDEAQLLFDSLMQKYFG